MDGQDKGLVGKSDLSDWMGEQPDSYQVDFKLKFGVVLNSIRASN